MKHLLACIMLLATHAIFCQTNVAVGSPAPAINITEWLLNPPEDTVLTDKFIVLEFWATWCKPCLEVVPHMTELQEAFPREDLYFISITDESPEQARTVFDKVDFQSIVVTDEYEETQRNFGNGGRRLTSYPLTVLINKNNIVHWVGSPYDLNEEILAQFLSGKDPEPVLTPEEPNPTDLLQDGESFIPQKMTMEEWYNDVEDSTVTWMVSIWEIDEFPNITEGSRAMWSSGKDGYTTGSTLREIFQFVFPEHKLVLPLKYEARLYAFAFIDKMRNRDSPKRIRKELFAQLGMNVVETVAEGWSHTITIRDATLLEPSNSRMMTSRVLDDELFTPLLHSLSSLSEALVRVTDHKWVFRGKDKRKYDFEIDLSDRETMISSLERYGLKVKSKPTKISVVQAQEIR